MGRYPAGGPANGPLRGNSRPNVTASSLFEQATQLTLTRCAAPPQWPAKAKEMFDQKRNGTFRNLSRAIATAFTHDDEIDKVALENMAHFNLTAEEAKNLKSKPRVPARCTACP